MSASWCIVGVGEDLHRVILDRGISYERAVELRLRLAECEVFREVRVEPFPQEPAGGVPTAVSAPAEYEVALDI